MNMAKGGAITKCPNKMYIVSLESESRTILDGKKDDIL